MGGGLTEKPYSRAVRLGGQLEHAAAAAFNGLTDARIRYLTNGQPRSVATERLTTIAPCFNTNLSTTYPNISVPAWVQWSVSGTTASIPSASSLATAINGNTAKYIPGARTLMIAGTHNFAQMPTVIDDTLYFCFWDGDFTQAIPSIFNDQWVNSNVNADWSTFFGNLKATGVDIDYVVFDP